MYIRTNTNDLLMRSDLGVARTWHRVSGFACQVVSGINKSAAFEIYEKFTSRTKAKAKLNVLLIGLC